MSSCDIINRVMKMKQINWWAVMAGAGLLLILLLAFFPMLSPGKNIVINDNSDAAVTPADVVFATPGGKKYHREDCSSLNGSEEIWEFTPDAAEADGYEACLRCKPR